MEICTEKNKLKRAEGNCETIFWNVSACLANSFAYLQNHRTALAWKIVKADLKISVLSNV